jgi:hypothetical protein
MVTEQLVEARLEKGMSVAVQVKGFKGNFKKFDTDAKDSSYGEESISDLLHSFIQTGGGFFRPDEEIYKGSTVILAYHKDNEELEEYLEAEVTPKDIKTHVLSPVLKFCKAYTKFSKGTVNAIKKFGADKPLEEILDALESSEGPFNNIIPDSYYSLALYDKNADPKKPFVYSAKQV